MNDAIRVAVLHYHQQKGGVTRVIQNSCSALKQCVDYCMVSGVNPADSKNNVECACHELQGLGDSGYAFKSTQPSDSTTPIQPLVDKKNTPIESATSLIQEIFSLQTSHVKSNSKAFHIWHVHNHALGKNPVFTEITYHLALARQSLLLQIHDFAEDGRPSNYQFLTRHLSKGDQESLSYMMYPQASHVHYAVLNNRDRFFLQQAGIPAERLHSLPNPVAVPSEGESIKIPQLKYDRLFIYPTRAIRRKNIGEFLLWSAMAEPGDLFALTLAPQNPTALPIYNQWKSLADRLQLPVEFEVGTRLDVPFATLMRSADALVTTSIAEGFGLAFLEPWLFERPLIGRNLPEITIDFQSKGIDLSNLYSGLLVPLDWIDESRLKQKITHVAQGYFDNYNRSLPPDFVDRVLDSMIVNRKIEFGRLDEEFQETIIEIVSQSKSARSEILPKTLFETFDNTLIEHNKTRIENEYSLEQYGVNLWNTYQSVLFSKDGPLQPFSVDRLLDCFLEPKRFSLLRTS
jgi:glycosyltransferase involved in cell wall biosynthesis